MARASDQFVSTKEVVTDLKWFIGISISVVIAFLGYLFAMINGIAADLKSHKENTAVHRTAEEIAIQTRADTQFREYVMKTLDRIEKKVDERR